MSQTPKMVTLRLSNERAPAEGTLRADVDPDHVQRMVQQAERMGLPTYSDPSIAALLAAVQLRPDVPQKLYAAFSAVLSRISAAAEM